MIKTKGIKKCREDVGMTQAELAVLLGVSPITVSNYENGKREPSVEKLKQMAKIFKVTVDELIS